MRAARIVSLVIALSFAAACRQDRADENLAMDNGIPANADIEALPPDESSAAPGDQLDNGADNASTADLNATNSY